MAENDPIQSEEPRQAELGKSLGGERMGEKDSQGEETPESVKANIKRWTERIRKAKVKWEPDFKRMRENMEFVAGYQWAGQKMLLEDRYICNFTLRAINQKVATLYARNPRVVANRRQRLDFELWDGKMETLMQAVGVALGTQQTMGFVPPEVMAMMNDFQRGRMMQAIAERVGRTLEIVTQYQMDSQEPEFKTQAKQFVRRAAVCGVSYMKVIFCRDYETDDLTHTETRQSSAERMLRAKLILDKLVKGDIQDTDASVETLKSLVQSVNLSPTDRENIAVKERVIYDFPPATAIIPDEQCRCIKGFVGAHYIAEEFIYPLDYVNAMFETDIKPGGDLKHYTAEGAPQIRNADGETDKTDPTQRPRVCLWQVYDLDTKSTFVLCDGYNKYVMEPEVLTPSTKSFWVHFPLTFNDIESDNNCKSTIFPPSDVQLLMPSQKEWNRSRQALREQRKANAPMYMCMKGTLSAADKDHMENAVDNQVVELENLTPGADPSKVVVPRVNAPIDPAVYDTKPLSEDALLSTGQQEANVGPAQPNVTATVGTIAEQSRMTVAASNVDDLDDCLSATMKCSGEMLMREMSPAVVKQIAGPGAVWPEVGRESFLNEIELEVVAASSGRPNKAIEVANFEKMAPLLLQAGANPQAIIREAIKRLDDRLDPTDFFPIPGAVPSSPSASQPAPGNAGQNAPPKPKRANTRGEGQMNPTSAAPVPQLGGA